MITVDPRVVSGPVEWGAQEPIAGFPVFAPQQQAEVRHFDLNGDGRLDILRTGEQATLD